MINIIIHYIMMIFIIVIIIFIIRLCMPYQTTPYAPVYK